MLSRPKELLPLPLLLAFNLESTLKRQAGRTPDRTSKLAMVSLSLSACEHEEEEEHTGGKKEEK